MSIFSTIPNFSDNILLWEQYVCKESIHTSESHESSTKSGRNSILEGGHNEANEQFAAFSLFGDNSMVVGMVENLEHSVTNVRWGISCNDYIVNIDNPLEYMHTHSLGWLTIWDILLQMWELVFLNVTL